MKIKEFLRHFPNYIVSQSQLAYADYLERQGLRLCIDFGFENAEDMAWDRLEAGEYQLGHA